MTNERQTCAHLSVHLARAGASNGVGLWCPDCERWATKDLGAHVGWALPKTHPRLAGVQRDRLPLVHAVAVECEICEIETHQPELHHWCPRALYTDLPHEGPTAYLCPDCHRTWHNIVTPGLLPLAALELVRALYKRMKSRPGAWTEFVRTVNDADAKVRRRMPPPMQEAA